MKTAVYYRRIMRFKRDPTDFFVCLHYTCLFTLDNFDIDENNVQSISSKYLANIFRGRIEYELLEYNTQVLAIEMTGRKP